VKEESRKKAPVILGLTKSEPGIHGARQAAQNDIYMLLSPGFRIGAMRRPE